MKLADVTDRLDKLSGEWIDTDMNTALAIDAMAAKVKLIRFAMEASKRPTEDTLRGAGIYLASLIQDATEAMEEYVSHGSDPSTVRDHRAFLTDMYQVLIDVRELLL